MKIIFKYQSLRITKNGLDVLTLVHKFYSHSNKKQAF